MRRLFLAGATLLAACLISNPAAAQGDAEAGRTKAYTCTGCHGIPGYMNVYPTYHVPKLAGQCVSRRGTRTPTAGASTPPAQARSLSDQDIRDIASYFAGQAEVQQ